MRQLAADVQQAWLNYASSDRIVATLDAMLPVLDENLRVSDRLVSAGQATPDVVLRARADDGLLTGDDELTVTHLEIDVREGVDGAGLGGVANAEVADVERRHDK